jgi:hypothetical protein
MNNKQKISWLIFYYHILVMIGTINGLYTISIPQGHKK